MGQAKNRGSQEQRIAEAVARERAKFPDSVKCNECQADLFDIHPMGDGGVPGMRLLGAAHCEACSSTTWIMDGTPEALEAIADAMEEFHGKVPKAGLVQSPSSR